MCVGWCCDEYREAISMQFTVSLIRLYFCRFVCWYHHPFSICCKSRITLAFVKLGPLRSEPYCFGDMEWCLHSLGYEFAREANVRERGGTCSWAHRTTQSGWQSPEGKEPVTEQPASCNIQCSYKTRKRRERLYHHSGKNGGTWFMGPIIVQYATNIMKAIAGSGLLAIPFAVQKAFIFLPLKSRLDSSLRSSSLWSSLD